MKSLLMTAAAASALAIAACSDGDVEERNNDADAVERRGAETQSSYNADTRANIAANTQQETQTAATANDSEADNRDAYIAGDTTGDETMSDVRRNAETIARDTMRSGETAARNTARTVSDTARSVASGYGAPVASLYEIQSRDDVQAFVENVYERADDDDNGELSQREFAQVHAAFGLPMATVEPMGDTDPSTMTDGEANAEDGADEMGQPSAFFAEVSGEDDMLARQELRTALTDHFDEADENGDGELSATEVNHVAEMISGA